MKSLKPRPTAAQARILLELLDGRPAGSTTRHARGFPATLRALIRRRWIDPQQRLTAAGEQLARALRRCSGGSHENSLAANG